MVIKEQEARLHQKDKELAEHRQVAAEEKHDTCARELKSECRQSKQLEDEIIMNSSARFPSTKGRYLPKSH